MTRRRLAKHLGLCGCLSPLGRIYCRQRVEAGRVLCHGVCYALCVEEVRILREVVNGVSCLVVVDIVCDARLAAKEEGLLGRLDALGPREDASSWDAILNERGIVGSTAELGGYGRGILAPEEFLERLFEVG